MHNNLRLQLSKLACIPFILLIEYLVYNKSVSGSIQCTLIPITLGVGYATVYDVNLHLFGIGKIKHIGDNKNFFVFHH